MSKTNFVSKRVYSLPVIAYLETRVRWEVSVSNEADPLFSFSWRRVEAIESDGTRYSSLESSNFNVFAIRETLSSVRAPEDALTFFRTFGPWQITQHLGIEAGEIRFSGLIRQRDFYQNALLLREIPSGSVIASGDEQIRAAWEDYYLWQPLPMEMVFRQPPVVVVRSKDIQDAMRASVFLDRLDGFPWRRCAREDCGKIYKLESKRARIYCSTDCAHLQSVRSYNNRERAKAALGPAKPKARETRRTTSKKQR